MMGCSYFLVSARKYAKKRADDIRPYEKVSYICVILSEPEANRRIYAVSIGQKILRLAKARSG